MTRGLRILPAADADADDIAFFIAQDDLDAALRFYDAMESAYLQIRDRPESCPIYQIDHSRLTGLRKFLIQQFDVLIFFRIDADMVEIIRVLHGARDIPSLFVGDPVEGDDPSTP
jgi:toxin ParE1/3/4